MIDIDNFARNKIKVYNVDEDLQTFSYSKEDRTGNFSKNQKVYFDPDDLNNETKEAVIANWKLSEQEIQKQSNWVLEIM